MYKIRPWLSIGKYSETLLADVLAEHGIGAMLQLAAPAKHMGIDALYLMVEDGVPLHPAFLDRGVRFVREQKAEGRHVLIACGAGISRAVTFATAALKEEEDVGLLEAFSQIAAIHPYAMPHPELWKSLCAYYAEDVPFLDMWRRARRTIAE
jgi:predicted protein tyrosine phosphatase